jgi:predicted metal-dependent peptidase
MSGFTWDGGGGTSMNAAVEFADKQKTDCIVVITDGETDWPRKRTRARLVIAIVRECSDPTPSWARVVQCWEGTGYEG